MRGRSMTYVAGAGEPHHVDLPRDTGGYRHAHAERKPKPTGLDWDALTPRCTSCGQKSGQLHDGHCPACRTPQTPAPAATSTPATGAGPRRRPSAPPRRSGGTPKTSAAGTGKGKPTRQPAPPRGPRVYRAADGTPIKDQDVIDAYTNGETAPAISRRYGVLPKPIRAILARNNVTLRDDRSTASGGKTKIYDPNTIAQVEELYGNQHLTQAQVAERLGVSSKVIWRIIDRHPTLQARPSAVELSKQGTPAAPRKISLDQHPVIAARYQAGEAGAAIGRDYGASAPSIYAILRSQGVTLRSRGDARRLRASTQPATTTGPASPAEEPAPAAEPDATPAYLQRLAATRRAPTTTPAPAPADRPNETDLQAQHAGAVLTRAAGIDNYLVQMLRTNALGALEALHLVMEIHHPHPRTTNPTGATA